MGEQSWEQEVLDVAAGTKASDALERPGRQLHCGQPEALRASGGGDEDETATPRGAVISSPGKMHLS